MPNPSREPNHIGVALGLVPGVGHHPSSGPHSTPVLAAHLSRKAAHRHNPMHIACADIGSVPQGNFAWASSAGAAGTLPSELAAYVASVLNSGESIALGFECPLFVPVPESEQDLGKSRLGEGSRPWSAGAGSGALATGLAQVAWVLARSRTLLRTDATCHLAWNSFAAAPRPSLLVWEAFVSGSGKGGSHVEDARLAIQAFQASLPNPHLVTAVRVNGPVQSMAGAALVASGWSTDVTLLSQQCIVIRSDTNAA